MVWPLILSAREPDPKRNERNGLDVVLPAIKYDMLGPGDSYVYWLDLEPILLGCAHHLLPFSFYSPTSATKGRNLTKTANVKAGKF